MSVEMKLTRRAVAIGAVALGLSRSIVQVQAQGTPEVDESVPGVVTVRRPIELSDDLIVDHYRLIRKDLGGGGSWAVIVGSFTNRGDQPIELPSIFNFDTVIRDRDDILLGSEFISHDYPVVPPGERIGFISYYTDVEYADVDPTAVEIIAEDMDEPTGALEMLAEQTLAIESSRELSRSPELEIEFVVRNTSNVAFENGLTPNIAVWDSAGNYCGSAYANVTTPIPPGDAIRFSTHSGGSIINPVDIAGPDFTWVPWIVPS